MKSGFSLSLDLVRIAAAFVVFVAHFAYARLTGEWLDESSTMRLATHAVMVFFVLSGLVIAYVASHREDTLRRFIRARVVRLYSVVLPMIVLAPLLDWIGRQWDPSLYDGWWYEDDKPYLRVPAALLFLHESWWTSMRYFSNGPYWSIAYEFWYYMAFAAMWFLAGVKRWLALAAVLVAAGPKIALLFPVWLAGVFVWRLCARRRLAPVAAAALLAAAAAGYGLCMVTDTFPMLEEAGNDLLDAAGFPVEALNWSEPWLSHYLLGIFIAAAFVALHGLAGFLETLLTPAAAVIRWVAGASFTMYLMHYPLMHAVASILPGDPDDPFRGLALFLLVMTGIFAIAAVTERRKQVFAKAYDYLSAKLAALAWLFGGRAAQPRL